MYLQADKPLFPHPLSTLPEEPFAEHEAAPEGKKEEKRSLKPPVRLYQLYHLPNFLDLLPLV